MYTHYFTKKIARKIASILAILGMTFGLVSTGVQFAYAAQLMNLSDTLSDTTAAALSNHSIVFKTPTGITAGQTVAITFTGYANLGQVGTTSIDVLTGNSTTTAAQRNVSDTNGNSQWGAATSSNVLTLTAPSSGTLPAAGDYVIINVGTNATNQVQGTQQITNPAAGSYQFTVAGNQADSGTITVYIIPNAVVSLSATINQSISFAILSSTSTAFNNSVYFGALTSANVKFASSSNVLGDTASTTAHVLTVSTNAPSGYVITLQGDTLRSLQNAANTVSGIGATASTSNAGTSQFGLNVIAAGGTGFVTNGTYGTTNRYGFNVSTSTADTLAFGNVPTTTTTYSISYIANIIATQAAGSYSAGITYVGTANF